MNPVTAYTAHVNDPVSFATDMHSAEARRVNLDQDGQKVSAHCSSKSIRPEMCVFMCCRRGDIFDRQKHEPGTEVKAITYSAMQINEHSDKAELYVIVDI